MQIKRSTAPFYMEFINFGFSDAVEFVWIL